jgi:hypothetical protein
VPRLEHLSVGLRTSAIGRCLLPLQTACSPPCAAASDTASVNPPLSVPQPYTPERESSISPPGQAALPCSRPVPERPVTSSRAGTGLDHTGHRAAHKSPLHRPWTGPWGEPCVLSITGLHRPIHRHPTDPSSHRCGCSGRSDARRRRPRRRRVRLRTSPCPTTSRRYATQSARVPPNRRNSRSAISTFAAALSTPAGSTGSVNGAAGKRDPSAPTGCAPPRLLRRTCLPGRDHPVDRHPASGGRPPFVDVSRETSRPGRPAVPMVTAWPKGRTSHSKQVDAEGTRRTA